MEYMFDTVNIEDIKYYSEFYKITGITSNPSIIKLEGKINFFSHFKEIRKVIGMDKSLHIQVVSKDYDGMMAEAEAIIRNVDDKVYIKVPVTEQGLKVIRALKAKGIGVTATAIYTKVQGLLAMESGADFIAPYYNRMENMDIDPREIITTFATMIKEYNYPTIILAASFKNMGQVNSAFECGAQSATVAPALLHAALEMPVIKKAVEDFAKDFETIFGKGESIVDL